MITYCLILISFLHMESISASSKKLKQQLQLRQQQHQQQQQQQINQIECLFSHPELISGTNKSNNSNSVTFMKEGFNPFNPRIWNDTIKTFTMDARCTEILQRCYDTSFKFYRDESGAALPTERVLQIFKDMNYDSYCDGYMQYVSCYIGVANHECQLENPDNYLKKKAKVQLQLYSYWCLENRAAGDKSRACSVDIDPGSEKCLLSLPYGPSCSYELYKNCLVKVIDSSKVCSAADKQFILGYDELHNQVFPKCQGGEKF